MTNDLSPVSEDLDSGNDPSRSTLDSLSDTYSVVAAAISNPDEELDLEAPNYDPPEPLLCSEVLDECDAMSDTSPCPEIPEEGPMVSSSVPKPQGPEGCAAVSLTRPCPERPEECPTISGLALRSAVVEERSTIDESPRCPEASATQPSQAGSATLNNLPCQVVAPIRPTTLDLSQSLRKHVDEAKTLGPRTNSDQSEVNENGIESCPAAPQINEEKRALEGELHKCIEDFRKIRIPKDFPNKKRHWQNELLRKYQL
ncbi:uncharacterized protein LOC144784207 [Lissotriton helveticus]